MLCTLVEISVSCLLYIITCLSFALPFCVLRTRCDRIGEAKASGNLGNTLKMFGKFDEAIVCCRRHLELSREFRDKASFSFVLLVLH